MARTYQAVSASLPGSIPGGLVQIASCTFSTQRSPPSQAPTPMEGGCQGICRELRLVNKLQHGKASRVSASRPWQYRCEEPRTKGRAEGTSLYTPKATAKFNHSGRSSIIRKDYGGQEKVGAWSWKLEGWGEAKQVKDV